MTREELMTFSTPIHRVTTTTPQDTSKNRTKQEGCSALSTERCLASPRDLPSPDRLVLQTNGRSRRRRYARRILHGSALREARWRQRSILRPEAALRLHRVSHLRLQHRNLLGRQRHSGLTIIEVRLLDADLLLLQARRRLSSRLLLCRRMKPHDNDTDVASSRLHLDVDALASLET